MAEFTEKVVIITGAANGMGAAHAAAFVDAGATVVLADVADEAGTALAARLGRAAGFVHLDVSSEEQWTAVVADVEARHGGIDVLVNNAGIHWTRPLEEETVEGFRRAIDVNLIGTFLGIRSVIGPMRRRGGGSIVNVASLAGTTGFGWHAAYGASKWGVRGLTKTAANELGQDGIRVNAVLPGAIETAMLPPDREGLGDARFARLPLARAGRPSEVSELVLFLAGDRASYVSGAEFSADGGSSAGPPLTPRPTAVERA